MKRKVKIPYISDKQKLFCLEYVKNGYNATLAAKLAGYGKGGHVTAWKLLRNAKIKDEIERLKGDLEKTLMVSKSMIINEHRKIAISSISHLHDTWITRKEFEDLTEDERACIQEISTDVKTVIDEHGRNIEQVYVKVKLYDKQKSLDAISKIMGYDSPAVHVVQVQKDSLKQLFPEDGEIGQVNQ